MQIELIKPYGKNAKKHPKKQIEQVAASIKEFGFNQPIVVDKNGVLIVGHGRLEAAKLLGITDVPTITVDLTEEQAKAYRLADNKLNESEWEMDLVIDELKGLSSEMFDLTGFDRDLIIEPDEHDDDVPDAPQEPVSILGDLYELGYHRVLCGDSTKVEDVERLMDGKKADMVFTDPPYNVNYSGKTKDALKIKNDKKNLPDFRRFVESFSIILREFTKKGGRFYVCLPLESGATDILVDLFHLQTVIVWVKNTIVMGRKDYQQQSEPILFLEGEETIEETTSGIFYGWVDGDRHEWYGGRKQSNIWRIDKPTASKQHPTMKPVELCIKSVLNSSRDGEKVLDLFLGSGSTLIAAEKTGRNCYGMELDPKYVDVIVQRYVDFTGNSSIKKNGIDIHWEKSVKTG